MLKRLMKTALAVLLPALIVAVPAKAELSDILSAGTIKIAIPENFPPFGSLGAEGDYVGYDVDVANLIAADAVLARRHQILTSIAGVGTLTANQLIATMPELGSLENKQAASLAGLAPVARQSGQWRGKSFIRGGRANVRQALYMPALVAARYNPDLKAKYQQLVTAGKPAKIAITAVMRKLVITANALLKADRCWAQSQT